MDSCVFLGANSSYSVLKDDQVYLETLQETHQRNALGGSGDEVPCENNAISYSTTEFIIELQVSFNCTISVLKQTDTTIHMLI